MTARMLWRAAALLLAAGFLSAVPGHAAAETGPPAGETLSHKVAEGDNLFLMAGYYYKDPRQWRRIFERNSDALADPNILLPGMVLAVEPEPDRQWDIPYEEFLSRVYD